MKTCNKCGETKPLAAYYSDNRNNDGKQGACKICMTNSQKAYRQDNLEMMRERGRVRANNDKEGRNARSAKYRKNNLGKVNARLMKYRADKLQATPPWFETILVSTIYRKATLLRRCGSNVEVDHIIPLRGKIVSGLHCAANLQILTVAENRSKSNKFAA